jgi:hypothetical protein
MKSNKIVCPYCYSYENIVYAYQKFICTECKKIITRCDICNYYCHNQCLNIFDKALSISNE